jgi:hypothetical protein
MTDVDRKNKRDFKGAWIPAEIWCCQEIKGDHKLVFAEIWMLDNEFGCVAGNDHFVDMFGIGSVRKVQRILQDLKKWGFITVTNDKVKDIRTIRTAGHYKRLDYQKIKTLKDLQSELYKNKQM